MNLKNLTCWQHSVLQNNGWPLTAGSMIVLPTSIVIHHSISKYIYLFILCAIAYMYVWASDPEELG